MGPCSLEEEILKDLDEKIRTINRDLGKECIKYTIVIIIIVSVIISSFIIIVVTIIVVIVIIIVIITFVGISVNI